MEKVIILVSALMLTGCFGDKLVKPNCGETAVYKKYNITMPPRPALQTSELPGNATAGQTARAYENDLVNMVEYALQLENILDPIVKGEETTELTTVPGSAEEPVKEESSWWKW